MARRGGGDSATVVYPPGCREVNDELGNDELIRRLKSLAHTFQGLGQVRKIFNFHDVQCFFFDDFSAIPSKYLPKF